MMPILGFILGIKYQEVVNSSSQINIDPTPTLSVNKTCFSSIDCSQGKICGIGRSLATMRAPTKGCWSQGDLMDNTINREQNSYQSLIEIMNRQQELAKKQNPQAQLFEMHTSIRFNNKNTQIGNPQIVDSYFALPNDNINYLLIGTRYDVKDQPINEIGTRPFIGVSCGGAARTDCGKATGQAENLTKHLPIQSLKIDTTKIAQILYQYFPSTDDTEIGVILTTPVRLGLNLQNSNSQTILYIRLDYSNNNHVNKSYLYYHYLVLNPENGQVLEKGSTKELNRSFLP